jgi:hypothetical protein
MSGMREIPGIHPGRDGLAREEPKLRMELPQAIVAAAT